MYLLALKDKKKDGAFSIINEDGEKVLLFFEQHDDAKRYLFMLEDQQEYPPMEILEYDSDVLLKTIQVTGHNYTIVKPYDLVVPPKMYN